jgi:hypothetical protein
MEPADWLDPFPVCERIPPVTLNMPAIEIVPVPKIEIPLEE